MILKLANGVGYSLIYIKISRKKELEEMPIFLVSFSIGNNKFIDG
jgi:hypothetical protein